MASAGQITVCFMLLLHWGNKRWLFPPQTEASYISNSSGNVRMMAWVGVRPAENRCRTKDKGRFSCGTRVPFAHRLSIKSARLDGLGRYNCTCGSRMLLTAESCKFQPADAPAASSLPHPSAGSAHGIRGARDRALPGTHAARAPSRPAPEPRPGQDNDAGSPPAGVHREARRRAPLQAAGAGDGRPPHPDTARVPAHAPGGRRPPAPGTPSLRPSRRRHGRYLLGSLVVFHLPSCESPPPP